MSDDLTDLKARARAEKERRERGHRTGGPVFYDADDPDEPEKSIREHAGTALFIPEEQDEEELKVANCDVGD